MADTVTFALTATCCPPYILFILVCSEFSGPHAPAATRAALWQGDRDSFIHARWDGTARLPAIAAARFAAWPLWVGLWYAARMRCGLPLARAQRCLQFPAQPLGFLLKTVDLFAQPVIFLLHPVQLSFRNK